MALSTTLRHRFLTHLHRRLGAPSLRLVFWDGERFDFAADPAQARVGRRCFPRTAA